MISPFLLQWRRALSKMYHHRGGDCRGIHSGTEPGGWEQITQNCTEKKKKKELPFLSVASGLWSLEAISQCLVSACTGSIQGDFKKSHFRNKSIRDNLKEVEITGQKKKKGLFPYWCLTHCVTSDVWVSSLCSTLLIYEVGGEIINFH